MFGLIADDVVYLEVPEEIFLESEEFIEWAEESLLIQRKRK